MKFSRYVYRYLIYELFTNFTFSVQLPLCNFQGADRIITLYNVDCQSSANAVITLSIFWNPCDHWHTETGKIFHKNLKKILLTFSIDTLLL